MPGAWARGRAHLGPGQEGESPPDPLGDLRAGQQDRDLFRVILLHTDVLEVMATPEPVSVEGSGAASSSSSASSSKQKRIAELSEEE